MKIRHKILGYFSVLSISLVATAFLVIYTLFSNYRKDEFQRRLRDQTFTTLKFLVEVKQIDNDLLRTIDKNTINSLYQEKILIYNEQRELLYTSLDDTRIDFPEYLIEQLSKDHKPIELKENQFDLVAVYFEFENKKYYGIAKAYDQHGYAKLHYLRNIMIVIFSLIAAVILMSSFVLARQISQPINKMTDELNVLDINSKTGFLTVPSSGDEIEILAGRFNELIKRLDNSFSFQKHAVQHISHELKTPIAKLVSNFEKLENEQDIQALKAGLLSQKVDTKNLGDIVNALLEISKVESGNQIDQELIRVDELLFDIVEENKVLNENFHFEVELDKSIANEDGLLIKGNKKLLRIAIVNLLDNCVKYSTFENAEVKVSNKENNLLIEFVNTGQVIPDNEKQFIFEHFFRGSSSIGKRGFGLGLVLTNKIINLHKGKIEYSRPAEMTNSFVVILPLEKQQLSV